MTNFKNKYYTSVRKYIVTDEAFCLEKGVKFEKCVSVLQNMVLKSWSNRWMN